MNADATLLSSERYRAPWGCEDQLGAVLGMSERNVTPAAPD